MTPERIRCLQICGLNIGTQQELAEALGVNRWSVVQWMKGKQQPSSHTRAVMASKARKAGWTPDKCFGVCN